MNQYFPDNVLKIPNATPDNKDAAQYMIYKGRKQYNLCGEFCVAFCMQDEAHTDNIDDFLNYWEAKEVKWFDTLFNKDKLSRTTSIYDLNKMLSAYGVGVEYPPALPLRAFPLLPDFASLELSRSHAIIGVQIDNYGYLVGKGIPHWVVLDGISVIDNNHAIVTIYNPFSNAMEPYTWRELMTSTGAYKQGLWIER